MMVHACKLVCGLFQLAIADSTDAHTHTHTHTHVRVFFKILGFKVQYVSSLKVHAKCLRAGVV